MKRITLILSIILTMALSMSAKDTISRNVSVLPKGAQSVLAANCKSKVSLIKIDKELGRISDYEVILMDGTEIEFDRNGNWKSVETANNKSVPAGFVPKGISDYVKTNHKGTRIVGIEKERSGYDVELSNGIDMKFDKDGNFLRFDR